MVNCLLALLFLLSLWAWPWGPRLTFSDEFSGTTVNASKWTRIAQSQPSDPYWGLQYLRPEDVYVSGGLLHVRAQKRSYEGAQYTAGWMYSKPFFSQRYGAFEARIKMPKGAGLWPAFWLVVNDFDISDEIDIAEYLGSTPNVMYFSTHKGTTPENYGSKTVSWTDPKRSLDSAFHVYRLEWSQGLARFLVDDIERGRITELVPSSSLHIVFCMQVGGGWGGPPDASTVFPAEMLVDWVRVYR